MPANRLIIKVTRDTLPQVKDKYPFLYLERGRLEVDDSSVKWIDSEGSVIKIPIATVNCLLLGPGTSITHEAVKVLASANCIVCWVGEDSFRFYASGVSPTSNTRNMRKQILLSSDPVKSDAVAKRMFKKRFPDIDIKNKTLQELMGMEGMRVGNMYAEAAKKYNVPWHGRRYTPGKFELSDFTNKILTSSNDALYAVVTSSIMAMGYSPHVGFIHSGSPLPFVYDIADLYKGDVCVDLAFELTYTMAGIYDRHKIIESFRKRMQSVDVLGRIGDDIKHILDAK